VGLRWPQWALVSLCWPSLSFVGYRGSILALSEPSLETCNLLEPAKLGVASSKQMMRYETSRDELRNPMGTGVISYGMFQPSGIAGRHVIYDKISK
jgi:hypothetical protein